MRSSVVCQSIQASVIDVPWASGWLFDGKGCLPGLRLLSSMRPFIDEFPADIWFRTLIKTLGCLLWSLLELPWLQSTMIDFLRLDCSRRSSVAWINSGR